MKTDKFLNEVKKILNEDDIFSLVKPILDNQEENQGPSKIQQIEKELKSALEQKGYTFLDERNYFSVFKDEELVGGFFIDDDERWCFGEEHNESSQKNEATTKSFSSVADAVNYLRNKYDKQYVGGIYVDDSRNPRYIYGNNDDGKGYIKIAEWHGSPEKTCTIFIESAQRNEADVHAGSRVSFDDLEVGNSYVSKKDILFDDVENLVGDHDIDALKEKGFINDKNEVVFPAGTKLIYKGAMSGAEVFNINGEEFDLSLDDVELYNAVDSNIKQGYNADFAKELINKFGKKDYEELIDLAHMTDDIELYPKRFISDVKEYTKISSNYIDRFMQMYNWEDTKQWLSALK